MKKKMLCLLLTLLLVLLCGACDTEPVGEERSMTPIPGYQYGNMQKDENGEGNFLRTGDAVLIEYNPLMGLSDWDFAEFVYDMKTGEVSLLCQEPACDHIWGVENPDNPEEYTPCISRELERLEQYDGRIFGVSGGSIGVLQELKDGGMERVVRRGVRYYCHGNDGALYVRTTDDALVVYENGSDTPRVLLEDYDGIWSVVFGDYLYGCTDAGVVRVDLRAKKPQTETVLKLKYAYTSMTNGQYIYYRDMDGGKPGLFRCDMDGSNPTMILDKPVTKESLNFDGEYLYFVTDGNDSLTAEEKHGVYRMSREDPAQVECIATLPEYAYEIYTVPGFDKIFVTTVGFEMEQGLYNGPVYAVSIDGSGAEALPFPVD